MNLFKKLKAQIALEALIILGVFIIGVIIFATFYFQSITPKDNVDFEFGFDRVFNKTPNSPLVIIDDSDPEDPEDPELPEEYTFSDLVLILDPETSSLVNQDFNIIARINSDYGSANVDLIEVTKYDDLFEDYMSNSSCELNSVYDYSFSNAGTLTPLDSNHLSNSFTFSCNSPGQYNFKFTVSNDNDSEILFNDLEGSEYFDGKEIEIDTLCLAGQPGEGSGTEEDPKIICTPKELHDVRDHTDWYYVLGQDIDLNHTTLSNDPTATWYDDVNGWMPISNNQALAFNGTLDGNNQKIKNLYINRLYWPGCTLPSGLFGYIERGAGLKNINLEDINITGRDFVGSLVGFVLPDAFSDVNINNISVTGLISGYNAVGGIIGVNHDDHVLFSEFKFNGEIIGENGVGGLIGVTNNGNLKNSKFMGKIEGLNYVGGLIGSASTLSQQRKIEDSYSLGSIIGNTNIGGLIGFSEFVEINNSYSLCSISGDTNVGGLVGSAYDGDLSNCFYSGQLFANSNFGSLIGSNIGLRAYNNYWDFKRSNIYTNSFGINGSILAFQTKYLYSQNNFINWDFNNVWAIDEGVSYPYLKNNEQIPHPKSSLDVGVNYPSGTYKTLSLDIKLYAGGDIYYTLDGSIPSCSGFGTKYSSPITLTTGNTTLKIIGCNENESSDLKILTYILPEPDQIIYSVNDLNNIKNNLNYFYVLGQDLDLNISPYNTGDGFISIGSLLNPFTGGFDGNGHTIKNLYTRQAGLFGYASNSIFNNLILEDINIYYPRPLASGALVGKTNGGIISKIKVNGEIIYLKNSLGTYGGVVGSLYNGFLELSSFSGNVNVKEGFGGLVGFISNGFISNCYSSGNLSTHQSSGGLIGKANKSLIVDSYSNVDINAYMFSSNSPQHIGGISGNSDSWIINSYYAGSIFGAENSYVKCFIGLRSDDGVYNNYNDSNKCVKRSLLREGKTTTEMTTQSTYNDWNFTDIWQIEEGCYPILKENPQEPICPQVEKVSTPVADPVGGSYTTNQYVTLSTDTPDAVIYYTLNGVDPTPPSVENKYTQPILIIPDKTLKARAYKQGMEPSDIITETYVSTGLVNVPNFNPYSSCNVSTSVINLTLSTNTSGATIRYTLDGSEPTESSPLYSNPITINTTTTIKAKAFRSGWTPSATSTKTYRVEPSWNYCPGILSGGVYHISQPQHLNCIRTNLDGNFVLDNDIDLAGINFESIGEDSYCSFSGNLNGNNYTISNLSINTPTKDYVGLFMRTQQSEINNLTLNNVNIVGKNYVGGLVGYGQSANIENINISGEISGQNLVGGLIGSGGYNSPHFINNVHANVNVSGADSVGGLIGDNGFYISNSYVFGQISGENTVGGFIGVSKQESNLTNCSSNISVSGKNNVGGFIGSFVYSNDDRKAIINSSYSVGSVIGETNVGGFIGNLLGGQINNNYTSVEVSRLSGNGDRFGGFLGVEYYGEVKNNYSIGKIIYLNTVNPEDKGFSGDYFSGSNNFWDMNSSNQKSNIGSPSAIIIGKTTSEMKTQNTFTNWDFINIWDINPTINNGYPYLRNNPPQ